MVVADRANGVKESQIILVRRVVAVPRHHIEGTVRLLIPEELPLELAIDAPLLLSFVLVPRDRRLKMHRIRQAIRPNRPQIRQHKVTLIGLANESTRSEITSRRMLAALLMESSKFHPILNPSLNHANLQRRNHHPTKLGRHVERALLWHDQKVAVRRVEDLVAHAGREGVGMDAQTVL